MLQSENLDQLFTALAKAQGNFKPAVFNKFNPHYKNKYADMNSCIESCRKPLSENGLSIIQYTEFVADKFMLATRLGHTSGQWMIAHYPLTCAAQTSQAMGSAITYAKRYALCAFLCISADEDDDAEQALQEENKQIAKTNEEAISKKDCLQLQEITKNVPAEELSAFLKGVYNHLKINDMSEVAKKDLAWFQQQLMNFKKYYEQKQKNTINQAA